MIRLATLLFVAMTVAQQVPARDPAVPTPTPAGTASISGTIIDETRQPIRRATVTASGPSQTTVSAITDEAGRFSISGLPAGRFTITAKKAGFPSVSYGASRPNRPGAGLLLVDGQQATNIALTLAHGGVLTGTVFDERSQPMPGVPLMAWEVRTTLSGDRTLDFPATGGVSVTTDDRGMYRIFGLPPGEYTVGTAWYYSGGGFARVPSDAEIREAFTAATRQPAPNRGAPPPGVRPADVTAYSYVPIFVPSAVDPLSAQVVELAPGQEHQGLDIRMQFSRAATLAGVVTGPDGPAGRATLGLTRRSKVQSLNSTRVWGTDADGKFTGTNLAPGDYTLRALVQTSEGGGYPVQPDNPVKLWAQADITVAGAPVSVNLFLQPAMTLTGRAEFDASTTSAPAFSNMRVSLTSVTGDGQGAGPVPVSADGTFSLPGVTPGTFRVTANVPAAAGSGPSAWMLASVVMNGRNVTDLPVEIGPNETLSFTVTVTDRISELSGTIADATGRPGANYFVIVVPADRQYWMGSTRRIANTRPDVNGRYVFRALPPGDYRIAVTTDLIPRDLADATALEQLMQQSAPLTIGLGEKKVFDIRTGQ